MRSAKKEQAKDIGRIPVERSSGIVFEDLEVPESAEIPAKAKLAARIAEIISERRLPRSPRPLESPGALNIHTGMGFLLGRGLGPPLPTGGQILSDPCRTSHRGAGYVAACNLSLPLPHS